MAVAKEVLKEGGNAFDAAIAAVIAMFMTEPCMASAGAGGFASCYTPGGRVEVLDFFTQTPGNKGATDEKDYYPILVNFGGETEEFHIGMASMAVPGMIAALSELHSRWGSMPMKTLVQASAHLRKDGVRINTFQALDLSLLEPVFRQAPEMKSSFFVDDHILKEGEILKLHQLENFLAFIIEEGARGFYQGEISRQISEDCQEKGGFLTREDFENYQCQWQKPHVLPYLGHQLAIPPYPSLGGMILSLIAHHRQQGMKMPATMDYIHEQYPGKADIVRAASRLHGVNYPEDMVASTRGTSHFNILDKKGNAIALTVTLGEGSGYFIPGTDMQMNNMLGETYLLPGSHFSWPKNCRMLSMMCPVMTLNENGTPDFIGGSGGAGRIPYALAQVMEKCIDENMSLKDAIEAPRMILHDQKFHLEKGHPEIHATGGHVIKHWDDTSLFFGGVHAITNRGSHVEAYGDPRRYGVGELLNSN